jgi:hypothetical protein
MVDCLPPSWRKQAHLEKEHLSTALENAYLLFDMAVKALEVDNYALPTTSLST